MNTANLAKHAAALAFICATSPVWSAQAADTSTPRATPFVEVKPSAEPDHNWRRSVCSAVPQACSDAAHASGLDPVLYRAEGDASNRFYVITAGPQLLRLDYRAASRDWAVADDWDFTGYAPTRDVQGDGSDEPVSIYPALYPLGPGRPAVAVLSQWHESYSGGGGSWQYADFIELKPGGKRADEASVAGVPFSCGKSIRACFSEQDYKHSPHCSEDFEGALHLRFVPSDSPDRYDWVATWKETHWPGLKPKKSTTTEVKTVRLRTSSGHAGDGKLLDETVSFCEPINR